MQIADWTYSDKKPRTAEERRRTVAEKIAKERAKKAAFSQEDFTADGCAGKCNDIPQSESYAGKCNAIPQAAAEGPRATVDGKSFQQALADACVPKIAPEAAAAAPRQAFLCPDDDKNAKNVVTLQTDSTIHSTDNTVQEEQTHTHKHTASRRLRATRERSAGGQPRHNGSGRKTKYTNTKTYRNANT
jgi:hypothetical protein